MRAVAWWLSIVVVALAALVGLIALINSRDQAGLQGQSTGLSAAPGEPYRGRPALSAALKRAVGLGNVVVVYRGARPAQLAQGGKALEQAGQAVLLDHEPALSVPLAAVSSKAVEQANTPAELRDFIDYWLGRAGGTR